MEIVVRDTNAFKHFLEANNILFELNFKRTVRSYIILYGISILLIVTGFTKISDSGITTDYTNYTTHQHYSYTGTFSAKHFWFSGIRFTGCSNLFSDIKQIRQIKTYGTY